MAKILMNLLYLLPFFDAINGYMVRKYNFYGIGSFYHLLLVIIILVILFYRKKIYFGKYEKLLLLFSIGFLISIIISTLFEEKITDISIERVEKIICTVIFICGFTRMANEGMIKQKDFEKMLLYQCTIIPYITLFSDLTGLYNNSYITSNSGKIGFYTNLNEATLILLIIILLFIRKMLVEIKIKDIITLICALGCLILTESKTGIIFGLIFIFIFFIKELHQKNFFNGKIKKKTLVYSLCAIPLGILVIQKTFKSIAISFFQRQSYMYNALSELGFMTFITSGRIQRIQTLIFQPINKIMSDNIFIGILRILFGFGLANDYYSTLEMDLFDCIQYGGIFIGILWLIFNYTILKSISKKQKNPIIILYVSIIIMASIFMGHIWTGGVCGIYFSLMITCLSCMEPYQTFKERKN